MKTWRICKFCGKLMKKNAMGTAHPHCADILDFKRKYGGEPLFCKSRSQARVMAEGDPNVSVVDAGKDRVFPGSKRTISGGTRWAVVARD